MLAERENVDLDGENLSVIDCGSKHAIPFIARTCRALGIAVIVLHDRDILPILGDDETKTKITAQNRAEVKANEAIAEAVGDPTNVFIATRASKDARHLGQRPRQATARRRSPAGATVDRVAACGPRCVDRAHQRTA
jgi:hypothetical protein